MGVVIDIGLDADGAVEHLRRQLVIVESGVSISLP